MTNIRPFSNGSEFDEWNRCDLCTKGYDEKAREFRCPIEKAVFDAMATGTMPLALAKRGGWGPVTTEYGTFSAMHPCPEFEEESR